MNTIDVEFNSDETGKVTSVKVFPKHDVVIKNINHIVDENICSCYEIMHGREILDDIIDDLIRYRSELPTMEEYVEYAKG